MTIVWLVVPELWLRFARRCGRSFGGWPKTSFRRTSAVTLDRRDRDQRKLAGGQQLHDASAALGEIDVPTLITFGARDLVCSTRFASPLNGGIAGSELVVFDQLSHAGLHEDPETFNRATLEFLLRQRS